MPDWELPKRKRTHEIKWPLRVQTSKQALRFIEHAGFCVLFPVNNVPLPSLYFAVAKRLPARWGKHAELIWSWRESLTEKRSAFYAKYFKGRATFISRKFLPYFVAMHQYSAASEPERLYADGRISADARFLWETLQKHGAMPTLELRHACDLVTKQGNVRFKKAILELQHLLIVSHAGGEQETESWSSNRFDLVARSFPKEVTLALRISQEDARTTLARHYLDLFPGTTPIQVARLFGWTKEQAVTALRV